AASLHARQTRAGLPRGLHGLGWSLWDDRPAVTAARQWAEGNLDGLLLTGDVGVGKTWLAATATWELLRRRGVRWVSTARMLIQLRAAYNDEDRAAAIATLSGNGALVLDDLDKASPTEFGREVIYTAIDG